MEDHKKFSPKDRVAYFTRQLEDIRKAMEVLKKFEELTEGWLKRTQSTPQS